MRFELIERLKTVTEEEKKILSGSDTIDTGLYTKAPEDDFKIDCDMLLEKGKLIDIRPHTRFVHFPEHTHNYIEMIYMLSGTTTHIINKKERIILTEGDLMFLNPNATQEILPAGVNDIAVNFIILPEFFDRTISMIDTENQLRDFLIAAISGKISSQSYLLFNSGNIPPVTNLIENMIWTIFSDKKGTNTLTRTTMGLLFMNLSAFFDGIRSDSSVDYEDTLVFETLKYIENNYKDGTLFEISQILNQPEYSLSRLLKKHTGKNFKELLKERKLQQARYLITETGHTVEQIYQMIGYDNSSFFYRSFKEQYGLSPREYRKTLTRTGQ